MRQGVLIGIFALAAAFSSPQQTTQTGTPAGTSSDAVQKIPASAMRPTLKAANQAIRYFGTPPEPGSTATPVVRYASSPQSKYRPQAVVSGLPLIEPRGLVKGRGFLYISDSGKDETHNQPATIWRLEPFKRQLDVFYRGPLLVSSKWLWFVAAGNGRPDEIIVSDFGEEPGFHQQGSGFGAKVFAVEVKADGTAGRTRILHQGPPLRNPQGVTVIGDTVVLSDTRAGDITSRPDAPEIKFRNGMIFAIPLAGGQPTPLFRNQTFVTLVGSCVYSEVDGLYLRIWDIDGGRRDQSRFAWMDHSGFVSLKRTKVESTNPLRFGPLQEVPLIEELHTGVIFDNRVRQGAGATIRGVDGTTFRGGQATLEISPEVVATNRADFIAESPISSNHVAFEVHYLDAKTGAMTVAKFAVEKNDANPAAPFRDNKHGGALAPFESLPKLDVSVDGLAQTVTLFPPQGGISTNVWQGSPLGTPMASHGSWDQKVIWLTDLNGGPDGTGAVWEVPMPSAAEIRMMYTPGNAWTLPRR